MIKSVRAGDRIRSQDNLVTCASVHNVDVCNVDKVPVEAQLLCNITATDIYVSCKENLGIKVDGGDFVRVQTVLNQGIMSGEITDNNRIESFARKKSTLSITNSYCALSLSVPMTNLVGEVPFEHFIGLTLRVPHEGLA